ncbi:hypothetical protein [Neomoorella thermoacetica]|nr:hypothetical protein [Moorella thermoacetica]
MPAANRFTATNTAVEAQKTVPGGVDICSQDKRQRVEVGPASTIKKF